MSTSPRRSSPRLLSVAALVAFVAVGAVALPAAATERVVVVRPGDTLSEIALANGVTVARLVALNHLADPDRIYIGQRLRVSGSPAATSRPAPTKPAKAASPKPAAKPVVHVVRYGENLTLIARRYGTSISAIARANRLVNPSYLRIGQRLTIPGSSAPPATTSARPTTEVTPLIHVVQYGENLTLIAHHYGTSIAAIVRANGLHDPSYLRVGQRLVIPGRTTRTTGRGAPTLATGRAAIGAIIRAEAKVRGVPVAFALAVAWQESGWRAGAVSRAGAVGVMQLTPATAVWVATTMLGHRVELRDARSNVEAGVTLLRHYLDRYHGNKSLVLAAYYQGQTAADRHGVYAMTRPYIASILALEASFSH